MHTLKKVPASLAAFLLFIAMAFNTALAVELPSFAPLAKKAGPAVVNISTERMVTGGFSDMFQGMPPQMERFFEQFDPFYDDRGSQGHVQNSLGSGFIISEDGYIVTNNHVVEGADKVYVNLEGDDPNKKGMEAVIIGRDADTDLALLKVTPSKPLPTLTFGDSDALEVGDWVVAIGNPFGLSNTVTAGILSAKGRDIQSGPFDNFLQTDASINPGNSGGPLLNLQGEVVGINTAIVASGQGIGFAIPSNLAASVVADLKDSKRVSRGWLGVTIQDIDENTAKALGLEQNSGALIGSVVPGDPAEKAGMKAGDIVVKVGEKPIKNSGELLRAIADHKPGTTVKVDVIRNGKATTLNVTLGDRNKDTESAEIKPDDKSGISLGISVRALSNDDVRALQLPPDTVGLFITQVDQRGLAARYGLRQNDILLSANLTPLESPKDLSQILNEEAKKRGALLLHVMRRGEVFFMTIPLEPTK